MFTRDPNLIKQIYLVANKPSQTKWNDFFDFMASIQADIAAAYALLVRPVAIVLDEAGLLAVGPTLLVGHRAKRLDNGITYVKQLETGALITDWEAIGDTWITIPDVTNLQTELDLRLRKDIDDSTSFRLGLGAEWHTSPCVDAIPDVQPTRDVLTIPFWAMNKYFSHLTGDRNFTITVDHGSDMGGATLPILPGLVMNLLVRNNSTVGAVDFEVPDDLTDTGDGVAKFVLLNATFPVSIAQGSAAWITVLQLPIPSEDPLAVTGNYYFISVRQMAEPVIALGPVDEDIGDVSHGFYEGEYYPPSGEDLGSVGFALTDSLYEEATSEVTDSDAGNVSFEIAQGLYEEVIVIETGDEDGSVAFALTDSAYIPVIQTAGPYSETMSVSVVLITSVYRDSAEATGLISESMNVATILAGGAYTAA